MSWVRGWDIMGFIDGVLILWDFCNGIWDRDRHRDNLEGSGDDVRGFDTRLFIS